MPRNSPSLFPSESDPTLTINDLDNLIKDLNARFNKTYNTDRMSSAVKRTAPQLMLLNDIFSQSPTADLINSVVLPSLHPLALYLSDITVPSKGKIEHQTALESVYNCLNSLVTLMAKCELSQLSPLESDWLFSRLRKVQYSFTPGAWTTSKKVVNTSMLQLIWEACRNIQFNSLVEILTTKARLYCPSATTVENGYLIATPREPQINFLNEISDELMRNKVVLKLIATYSPETELEHITELKTLLPQDMKPTLSPPRRARSNHCMEVFNPCMQVLQSPREATTQSPAPATTPGA